MFNFTGFVPRYDELNIYRNTTDDITNYLIEIINKNPNLDDDVIINNLFDEFVMNRNYKCRDIEKEMNHIHKCISIIKNKKDFNL